MLRAIKLAIPGTSSRRFTSWAPCKRCHFASIVFVVRHLGNLGRRKFAVQVVSPRESTTRYGIIYKVSSGKVKVPARGFSPEYKEAARSFIPCTMHRSTAESRLDCTLKHSRNLVIASNLTYIYQCPGS